MKVMRYLVWILSLTVLSMSSCSENAKEKSLPKKQAVYGEAQGTTYSISYYNDTTLVKKSEIDSLLDDLDNSLSRWVESSLINQINNADTTAIVFDDYNGYFTDMVKYSRQVWTATNGSFDPTVTPLVDLWGFGREQIWERR